jgi:hypothetical protein
MKSEIKQLKAGLYVVAAIQLCSIAKAQVDTTVRPLTLNGSATMITLANGNPALRLTPALTNQAGSAFTTSSVTVNKFRVFFQFRITSGPGGYGGYGPGDGMALVLQMVAPDALGEGGGSLGYAGIAPSIAVEFDTYQNSFDITEAPRSHGLSAF